MAKEPKIPTSILSARIPVDVMNTLDELAKKQGLNRSQFLTNIVAAQQSNNLYKKGGVVQTRFIPKEVQDLLTGAGCSIAGILIYSLVSDSLEKQVYDDGRRKFSEVEVGFIGVVAALAVAVAGFGLVRALTSE